jgi:DnaJ-class molecular chaperone
MAGSEMVKLSEADTREVELHLTGDEMGCPNIGGTWTVRRLRRKCERCDGGGYVLHGEGVETELGTCPECKGSGNLPAGRRSLGEDKDHD